MPAEYEDGFSVREAMWHGLGTVLPDYMSRDASFAVSGQAWTVEQVPMFSGYHTDGQLDEVFGYFAARRSDTAGLLAVHKNSYEVLQNTEGWDLADAFADQDATIKYETAGCLQDGRTCFLLLSDETFSIAGDKSKTKSYLLVSWSHDGSAAMTARSTKVRVVCKNTLDFALAGSKAEYTFKHTRNVRDRIKDAKQALTGRRESTELYRRTAEALAKERVYKPGLSKFFDAFTGPVTTSVTVSDLQAKANSKARGDLVRILRGPTVDGSFERGFTGYDVLQAGVEYLDWGRKAKSQETRFTRTFLKDDDRKVALPNLVWSVVA